MDFSALCNDFYAYAKQNNLSLEELFAMIISSGYAPKTSDPPEPDNSRFSQQRRMCEMVDLCQNPNCLHDHPVAAYVNETRIKGMFHPILVLKAIGMASRQLEECPYGLACPQKFPGNCSKYHDDNPRRLVFWRQKKAEEEAEKIEADQHEPVYSYEDTTRRKY